MGLVRYSEGLATSVSRLPRSTGAISMGLVVVEGDNFWFKFV